MRSVFGGGGRTYYMLVHKMSSKYHKAGESQPIIVDEIEMGRGSQCQVRFDDSFTTVSRRHAAIVKDGNNWKLVQLSTTNSTYLNGQKVHKEWYLQNGDEIQLSTNGPKLGFIIPEGDKGKVSSIGLTARLNLFRKQALRPYKTALTVLGCALLLIIAGFVWSNFYYNKIVQNQNKQLAELIKENSEDQRAMDSLGLLLAENAEKVKNYEENMEKARQDLSRANRMIKDLEKTVGGFVVPTIDGFDEYMSSIYYCNFKVCDKDGNYCYGCSGTGFLLDDGRFVTAQHVVNSPVLYPNPNDAQSQLLNFCLYERPEAFSYKLTAVSSSGDKIEMEFPASEQAFHMGQYEIHTLGTVFYDGVELPVRGTGSCDYRDYAWIQTNKKGNISADMNFSDEMPIGTKLYTLGFPMGVGAEDIKEVSPIFSESSVARSGLDTDGCVLLSNSETDHGNSGGPVFTPKDGKMVVVGILSGANRLGSKSGKASDGKWKDRVVPMSATR